MSLGVEAEGYLKHIIAVMNSGHRLPYNRFHWAESQWSEYAGLQELVKDGWVIYTPVEGQTCLVELTGKAQFPF